MCCGAEANKGLEAFLSSLKPDLSRLLPVFVHHGMVNNEAIEGLLELSNPERDAFIDELRLNLLQTCVVKRGFNLLKK